jgi:hypothetical protein
VIEDLEVSGTPIDKYDGPAGIYIENSVDNTTQTSFRINNCVAHDLWYGISVDSYTDKELMGQDIGANDAVMTDVVVDGFEAYACDGKGIHFTGSWSRKDKAGSYGYAHGSNMIVRNTSLHDNGGDGIVVACTDDTVVEYTTAIHNGFLEDDRYGIWPWNGMNSTVQFCEAAFNETPENKGGGGLDCDYGVQGCYQWFNYVHDNEGPGHLLIGYGKADLQDARGRYNIYVDNCWHESAPDDGEFVIFGTVNNSTVNNNTIYYKNRSNNPGMFAALLLSTWGNFGSPGNFHFKNNIVYVDNGQRAYYKDTGGTFYLDNNLVYAPSGDLRISWDGEYSTLAAFCAATGQDCNSIQADPLLANVGGRDPADYMIASNSPAVDQAADLGAGLMGTQDYFGNSIPQGGGYDIGAHETAGGPPPPTDTPAPPTDTPIPPTDTPVPPTDTPGGPTDTPEPPPTDTPIPPTDTPEPPPTDTPEPPPTSTPGGSTVMHVEDLWTTDENGTPKDVFIGGEYYYVHGLIKDQNGSPVEGAYVSVKTTKPGGAYYEWPCGLTDATGECVNDKKINKTDPKGVWTVEVTDVTKDGATYDPNANVKDSHQFEVQ